MSVALQVTGLAVLAAVLMAAAVWILIDYRVAPETRERKRRLLLNERGRLADGTITETTADTIFYSYMIAGVAYTASQGIGALNDYLPGDPARLIGAVSLKYLPNNPANSIVLCESWSGLHVESKAAEPVATGSPLT